MPKNVLFHFSLIFDLIFENFKGVGFTDLTFQFIFDFIFDDLCLQKRTKNESKMDQKQEPWAPLFPPTAGGKFTSPFSDDFTNHTFNTTNPTDIDLSNIPENMDMSWALYNASLSSTTSAPTYSFDHTPAASQGYSFSNVDYLCGLRFGPVLATDNSLQPNPFLPQCMESYL